MLTTPKLETTKRKRIEDDSEHMEAGMEQECGGIDPAEKQDTAELTAASVLVKFRR